jgi:hypothetical protein
MSDVYITLSNERERGQAHTLPPLQEAAAVVIAVRLLSEDIFAYAAGRTTRGIS